MVRRKIADLLEAFLQQVFAELLAWDFSECGVEKRPVVLAQESWRDVLQRVLPPNGNGVFYAVKELQKRMWILHQER